MPGFGGDGIDTHGTNALQIEQSVGGFEKSGPSWSVFSDERHYTRPVYF